MIDPAALATRLAALSSRARFEGPRAWLEPLEDLDDWRRAPPALQDRAIAAALKILGPRFRLIDARSFGGDPPTRIARIRCALGPRGAFGYRSCPNLELALIPGGVFTMGDDADPAAAPAHPARIAPFLIGRALVSQRLWDALGGEDTRRLREPELPIHGLSWDDAEIWMARGEAGLRFPSEAEWEYACRAGGSGLAGEAAGAWHAGNSDDRPRAAAEHAEAANGFGLIDMLGNLREPCRDQYFVGYADGPTDEKPRGDIAGYDLQDRALRGGGYESPLKTLSCAAREPWPQDKRGRDVGLRVARSLLPYGAPA